MICQGQYSPADFSVCVKYSLRFFLCGTASKSSCCAGVSSRFFLIGPILGIVTLVGAERLRPDIENCFPLFARSVANTSELRGSRDIVACSDNVVAEAFGVSDALLSPSSSAEGDEQVLSRRIPRRTLATYEPVMSSSPELSSSPEISSSSLPEMSLSSSLVLA